MTPWGGSSGLLLFMVGESLWIFSKIPAIEGGRSLQANPGLFPYERVHFSQGTQIAGEFVSRFRQVHTG